MGNGKLALLNEGKRSPATNAPLASCGDRVGDDPADQEPLGDVPLMPCLGVTAIPYPPDAQGGAEGVVLEGVGGLPGVCVAAWDTRTFAIAGNASPGDTIVHTTGPSRAAQLQLKETKKQAVLVTRGSDGKQMMLTLDGTNDVVQVLAFGNIIEVGKRGISLNVGNSGIDITDDGVTIRGANVVLGGFAVPPGAVLACAPVAEWAKVAAATPGALITPLLGVKGGL